MKVRSCENDVKWVFCLLARLLGCFRVLYALFANDPSLLSSLTTVVRLLVSQRILVTFEIQPKWRTTSNTEAFFADGRHGLRGAEQIQELFTPLLDEWDNEGYNWANLDSDGWGELDHLVRYLLDPAVHNDKTLTSSPYFCLRRW